MRISRSDLISPLSFCSTFYHKDNVGFGPSPNSARSRIRKQNQGFVPVAKGGGAIADAVCSFARAPKREIPVKLLKCLAVS